LQVLSLVAMEPPVSLEAEPIRDEKVKLLKSIRPLSREDVARQVVRGQYFAGAVDGKARPGYRQEPKVKPDSNVETYVALKLFIRRDEVETAWQIVDGIRKAWESKPLSNREFYAAGTWGPVAAEDLLAQNGHDWREPLVVK